MYENPQDLLADYQLFAIVLAAGGSSRFQGIKQLVELEGKSLLKRTVETACNILDDRVKVVLGLKALKLKRELAGLNVEIIMNDAWQAGLSTSLQAGINALPDDCSGVLVIFCDQPLIREQQIQALIALWNRDRTRIIASAYAGIQGVPVIFPRKYFHEFSDLTGDSGAKSILNRHPDEIVPLPLPEAETDIDTQADLLEILTRQPV
jgi:CTP:molybdopterin cytidylyltransferase MocA